MRQDVIAGLPKQAPPRPADEQERAIVLVLGALALALLAASLWVSLG